MQTNLDQNRIEANPGNPGVSAAPAESVPVSPLASEKVREYTQGSVGEDQGSGATSQAKSTPAPAILEDREALKERLLASAPQAAVMREQIQNVLAKEKTRLERELRQSSKRDPFTMSRIIAELRSVVRAIEESARATYEVLKDMWLKFVHNLV